MQQGLINLYQRKRKAMTLTELAIVLGAVGMVSGAIWAVASVVWNDYRLQRVREQTMQVVENVRTYYGPMGGLFSNSVTKTTYAGSINAILDDNDHRLIPIEMRANPAVAGGQINHAASSSVGGIGSFRVLPINNINGTAVPGGAFRIRLLGLSRSMCMKLLMQFPVLSPEAGVVRIGAIGTVTNFTTVNINNMAAPGTVALPITAATAGAWCDITNVNNNEVNIDFRTVL